MSQINTETANATKTVDPDTIQIRDDGASTSSGVAPGNSKTASPQQPASAGWFHWHEPGTPPEEKRLIFKLDFFLLSFSCLMFFVKQLDQNNVSNAYVSGMADELGFGPGNELSWMNTYFNIGVIVGGSFANLIITVVRPRFWLPGCLLTWSIFVFFLYKCNHAYQFYVLRFFIGLFESAAWPGVMYCIGSWYRKSELARRSGLFVMSGVLGQMFSGYLQSALYTGMEGKGGLSAWRWLFIFDFVIAIPVIVYGVVCFPDTPHTTNAFYFNEWERQRARERIEEEGCKPVGNFDWSVIRRIFGSWEVYAFTAAYSFWTLTCALTSSNISRFTLGRLKSTLFLRSTIFRPASVLLTFCSWLTTGFVADKIGRRGPVCFAVGCLLTFVYAVLAAWSVPHMLRMAVFILAGCYGCYTPLLAGWTNEAVVIPFQQLQMPSSQAPAFEKTHGWQSSLAWVIALTLWTGVGLPLV
ncbi:major facilitator superfamily transporter [Paramyrothecium foliicola]|nr:major facilitator superfamily transporter [Paramyrothecium foliicola]